MVYICLIPIRRSTSTTARMVAITSTTSCASVRTRSYACVLASTFASAGTSTGATRTAMLITITITTHGFTFHSFSNHRAAQQSHSSDNRQSLFCSFLEEFSSALGFFLVVFHCSFCQVIFHLARRIECCMFCASKLPISLR